MGYSPNAYMDMPINHKIFLAHLMLSKNWQMKDLVFWSDDVLITLGFL